MSTTQSKTHVTAEPGQSTIKIERELDAPRTKVFRAMTDSELIGKWWGQGDDMLIDIHEPRVGGRWRFVQQSENGDFAFRGVYHDVIDGERIIGTFEFEGAPGQVVLENMTLTDTETGGTLIRVVSALASVEERDMFIDSGMEQGVDKSYSKLDEVAAALD
jgi:uncharacterized protein YndB with AHSA1/START domain